MADHLLLFQVQPAGPEIQVVVSIHFADDGVGYEDKPGTAPASTASIEALPKVKVKESGNNCSICLEDFKLDEEAKEMPCKHLFHSGCVEKWLRIHGSCPLCRCLMPTEDSAESGGGVGIESGETGLRFMQAVLAVASLASLIPVAGTGTDRESEQSGAGQADGDDVSSAMDSID